MSKISKKFGRLCGAGLLVIVLYMLFSCNFIDYDVSATKYDNGVAKSTDGKASAASISMYSGPLVTNLDTVQSTSSQPAQARITANVTTNNITGYKLMVSTASSETALTNIDPESSARIESIPTPGTWNNITENTWGYTLDNSTYKGFKSPLNSEVIRDTASAVSDENTSITISAKLNNSVPTGTYTNDIMFTATANNVPGFYQITLMQEMTIGICNSVVTPSVDATTTTHTENKKSLIPETKLMDSRDNKFYSVRKLADGNCWMAEDYQGPGEGTMNSNGVKFYMNSVSSTVACPGGSWRLPHYTDESHNDFISLMQIYNKSSTQDSTGWSYSAPLSFSRKGYYRSGTINNEGLRSVYLLDHVTLGESGSTPVFEQDIYGYRGTTYSPRNGEYVNMRCMVKAN